MVQNLYLLYILAGISLTQSLQKPDLQVIQSSGAWAISNPCKRWTLCKVKAHNEYIVADCLILSVRACKGTKGKAPKSSRPQRHTISPRKMPLKEYQLRYQVLFDRYEAQRLLVLLMFPDLKGTNKHTEAASRIF